MTETVTNQLEAEGPPDSFRFKDLPREIQQMVVGSCIPDDHTLKICVRRKSPNGAVEISTYPVRVGMYHYVEPPESEPLSPISVTEDEAMNWIPEDMVSRRERKGSPRTLIQLSLANRSTYLQTLNAIFDHAQAAQVRVDGIETAIDYAKTLDAAIPSLSHKVRHLEIDYRMAAASSPRLADMSVPAQQDLIKRLIVNVFPDLTLLRLRGVSTRHGVGDEMNDLGELKIAQFVIENSNLKAAPVFARIVEKMPEHEQQRPYVPQFPEPPRAFYALTFRRTSEEEEEQNDTKREIAKKIDVGAEMARLRAKFSV